MARLIGVIYVGGGIRPDVPCRDMDLADIERLTPAQREIVIGSDLFEKHWVEDPEEDVPVELVEDGPATPVVEIPIETPVDVPEEHGLGLLIEEPTAPVSTAPRAELIARAKELDIPATGTNEKLAAAISEAEARSGT